AEDGIRDATVTGVQTCALPISIGGVAARQRGDVEVRDEYVLPADIREHRLPRRRILHRLHVAHVAQIIAQRPAPQRVPAVGVERSEERRVGKEGRRWGWAR